MKKILIVTIILGFVILSCNNSSNQNKKNTNALLALYLLSQQSKTVASTNSCGYYANVTSGTVNFNATLNSPTVTVAPLLFATTSGVSPAAIVKVTLAASQKLTFTTTTTSFNSFSVRYYSGNQACPVNATASSSTVLTTSGDFVNLWSYGATATTAGTYTFVVFNPSLFITAPTDFTMQIQ